LLEVLLFKEKLAQDPEDIEMQEKLKESQKKVKRLKSNICRKIINLLAPQ
jgi:hypothetical protein